jgi:hypothetical protein
LESIELSAGCFDFVLHVLRHPTVNDRTAFLVDHQPEQLGDGQTFGLWVFSTASNHLATDKPEIVPVAVEGLFGQLRLQHVEQERLELFEQSNTRDQIGRIAAPTHRPLVQIWTGFAQQDCRVRWDNALVLDSLASGDHAADPSGDIAPAHPQGNRHARAQRGSPLPRLKRGPCQILTVTMQQNQRPFTSKERYEKRQNHKLKLSSPCDVFGLADIALQRDHRFDRNGNTRRRERVVSSVISTPSTNSEDICRSAASKRSPIASWLTLPARICTTLGWLPRPAARIAPKSRS